MALPTSGAGYQIGDGNLDECILSVQKTPTTVTAAATLAVADILKKILIANVSSGGNLQLPTVASLEATLSNAVKTGQSFQFHLSNVGTGASDDVTITTNTGWTLAGNMVVASNNAASDQSAGTFIAWKTGDSAWTLQRVS